MAIIVPIISKFAADGVKAAEQSLSGLQAITAQTGAAFRSAFLPATLVLGGLTAGITDAAKAAIEDAAAQDALARQLQVSTGATDAQVAAVEEYISAQSRLTATADDELRPALAQLVRATGDVARAQKLLSLAQDIAAGSGRGLETVSLALSKAATGQVGALTRLGVPLDKTAIKTKNLDAITAQLSRTFGGAAQRQAQTAEGRIRGFGIAIDEAKESIGAGLLPIISALLPVLQRATDFMARNTKAVVIAIASLASLAATVVAVNVAMRAYAAVMAAVTIATRIFNLVVKQNSLVRFGIIIGAVVVAMAALQAASRDTAKAMQVLGRVAVTIIGGTASALALLTKSILAGFYLLAKVGQGLEWVNNKLFPWAKSNTYANLAKEISKAGYAVDDFDKKALAFANAQYDFPAIIDRSAKAIKGLKDAASTKLPGAEAGAFPALDAIGEAATKSGAKAVEKTKAATKKVVDAAAKVREQSAARIKVAADRFRDAFGDYADRGLRAFDAQTTRLVEAIGANLDRQLDKIDTDLRTRTDEITSYYAGEIRRASDLLMQPSETEKELSRLERLRDEERAARDLRDAQENLNQVRSDAKASANDLRAAEERLADVTAQQALDALRARVDEEARLRDKNIENVVAKLEKQRDKEIRFAEQAAEQDREAKRKAAAERELEVTSQRELERENLERRLEQIRESVAKEPGIWQKAHEEILALFRDSFGPDYERAGQNLGQSFATGLASSLGRTTGAANALGTARAESLGGLTRAQGVASEINLVVNAGMLADGPAVGNAIVNALQAHQRRTGSLPLRVTGY